MLELNSMWIILFGIVAFFRFIIPPFVLIFPIITTIASNVLDSIDGYFAYRAGLRYKRYNQYDKILDLWWYVFILLYSVETPAFQMIFILFVYRTVGQVVALTIADHRTFIWFPNILELFFIAYLLSTISPVFAPLISRQLEPFTLGVCLLISLLREYVLHVKRASAAQFLLGIRFDWSLNERK